MNPPIRAVLALCAALAWAALPASAYADTAVHNTSGSAISSSVISQKAIALQQAQAASETANVSTKTGAQATSDKLLAYNPALIAEVGTQETSGHTICCCEFACAYADAVLDGTVNDHSYYGCGECTWTDWGGGNSFDRSVGDTDAQLLREAYDQISAGRPVVIHVTHAYGEHWIALIGYVGAADPDNLTLDNFVALDPWDGSQIVAGNEYELYGDNCEHVSDR